MILVYPVKSVILTMEDKKEDEMIHTGLRQKIYREQTAIKWSNLVRVRIHKDWHLLQKRDPGVEALSPGEWQYNLVEFVLGLLNDTCQLRCDVVEQRELETDRASLLKEYEEITRSPELESLGAMNAHLLENRNKPHQ